jgi:hypothetical protein
MANERKQYKSHPRPLKKIAATARVSKKVNELREDLEECISAGEQHGDGIIDNELRYLAKTLI